MASRILSVGSLSVLAQDWEQYGPRFRYFLSQNLQFFSLYIPGILCQAGYYRIRSIIFCIIYVLQYNILWDTGFLVFFTSSSTGYQVPFSILSYVIYQLEFEFSVKRDIKDS